jgi:hypothetical protein
LDGGVKASNVVVSATARAEVRHDCADFEKNYDQLLIIRLVFSLASYRSQNLAVKQNGDAIENDWLSLCNTFSFTVYCGAAKPQAL